MGGRPNANQVSANRLTVLHMTLLWGPRLRFALLKRLVNTRLLDLTPWLPIDYNLFGAGKTSAAIFALLLRAGSRKLPNRPLREHPYFSRILDAGGFKIGAHLAALAKTGEARAPRPPELSSGYAAGHCHARAGLRTSTTRDASIMHPHFVNKRLNLLLSQIPVAPPVPRMLIIDER